jgi:hypothetical protein
MTITISGSSINFGTYSLEISDTGISLTNTGTLYANAFTDLHPNVMGQIEGYNAGGLVPPYTNTIDKFPFSSPFAITDVGDLSSVRFTLAPQSSSSNGYFSGGTVPPVTPINSIDSFPFSTPFATATDAGDLSQSRSEASGQSSSTEGYTSGGFAPPFSNTIDKFPFSTPFTTASDVGDLTQAKNRLSGHSSATEGYNSGGNLPSQTNVIEKFPFSTPVSVSDIGDLAQSKYFHTSHSSKLYGFSAGGSIFTPSTRINTIERFPFSTPFTTASGIGYLSQSRDRAGSQNSTTEGYTSGGTLTPPAPTPANNINTIDKFPFTTRFITATDVGDLADNRTDVSGNQY